MGMSIDEAIIALQRDIHNARLCGHQIDQYKVAIATMHKYQQLEEFARWVAEEIIDEDMWEFNYLSFAELACRKLVKLGIMQESNGEYLYKVVEDGDEH